MNEILNGVVHLDNGNEPPLCGLVGLGTSWRIGAAVDVTCAGCRVLLTAPGGPLHRGTQAAPTTLLCVHYRTVAGPGPAACGVDVASGNPDERTSILDRVTCEVCKRVAPGMKYDGEKPRMALLPFGALEWVAKVMTYGARKYAVHNWKTLEDAEERYGGAMLRHYTAWQQGEMIDKESGLPHVAQIATNALFLCAFVMGTDGTKKKVSE